MSDLCSYVRELRGLVASRRRNLLELCEKRVLLDLNAAILCGDHIDKAAHALKL